MILLKILLVEFAISLVSCKSTFLLCNIHIFEHELDRENIFWTEFFQFAFQ